MGCSSSKDDAAATSAGDITMTEKQSASQPSGSVSNPSPVFKSDIEAKPQSAKTFSEILVKRNTANIHSVYDVDDGAVLGRGACGSVCVVKKKATGELFAMKTVALEGLGGGGMEELRKEIDVQRSLDHPNIARVFEYFEDSKTLRVHIVMELCTGGALVSRMKTHRHGYGERAAATLVNKMLSATLYCHHRGVVHRDIKLDNFIYENEDEEAELKLIDFGFAAEVAPGNESMWDQIGTPSYMAPELWADSAKEYDSSVDMWAIGVVSYMLLSGKRPFHHQDRKEKKRMIIQDPVRFHGPEWDRVTDEGKKFCTALMQKDPHKRLSASQALAHPWIKHASTLHAGPDAASEMKSHADIVESLEAYARMDDMKKVALEVIAFSTPPHKCEELRDLFVKMDTNNSGTITPDEFAAAMNSSDVPDVQNLFRLIDVNGDGEIAYMEFIAAAQSAVANPTTKPSIATAFSMIDRDGDGTISASELRLLMGEDDYTDAELEEMIVKAGGVNGVVSFDQFKSMMLSDMSAARGWKSSGKITAFAQSSLGSRVSSSEPGKSP